MQDHYQTLQIDPSADRAAIQAAYESQRQRYDPEQLAGAADELVEIARRKRDEIEQAYAVLSNSKRRAAYDKERQAQQAAPTPDKQAQSAADSIDDDRIDYSPLPPAHGQERPRGFDPQPLIPPQQPAPSTPRSGRQTAQQQRWPPWAIPVATVALLTFVIMLTSLIVTGGGQPQYANDTSAMEQGGNTQPSNAQAAAQSHEEVLGQYEDQVIAAQQVVHALPDNPDAWIRLGNALYDSVQVLREVQPDSDLYRERLSRWLEASEAYSQALALDTSITYPVVMSDMGVSLCYYGTDAGDLSYVEQGVLHTQRAVQLDDEDGRVLLNHGICLVSIQPPQTQEALALWQKVLTLPAAERGVLAQAQRLVNQYEE